MDGVRRTARPGRSTRPCRAALIVVAMLVAACDGDSPTSKALAAAVRIEAEGCRSRPTVGAGSFVGAGRVLTVAHVVAGSDHVDVFLANGAEVDAVVVAIDRAKDLAVLAVDADVTPLRIGRTRPGESGTFVVSRGDTLVTQPFVVRSFVDIDASSIDHAGSGLRKGFQIEANVSNGDSGSVLVHGGDAVGVVFARSTGRGDRAWATDIREAEPLLAAAGDGAVDVGTCAT